MSFSDQYTSFIFSYFNQYHNFKLKGEVDKAMLTLSTLLNFVPEDYEGYLRMKYEEARRKMAENKKELEDSSLSDAEKAGTHFLFCNELLDDLFREIVKAFQIAGLFESKVEMLRSVR